MIVCPCNGAEDHDPHPAGSFDLRAGDHLLCKVSSGGGWLLQPPMVVAHGLQMAQGSDVRRWLGDQNPAGLAEGHQATIRNRASGLSPVFC